MFRLIRPYLKGIAIKDFKFAEVPGKGWIPAWQPLGQGMVAFQDYFPMLKQAGFSGPVQMHFEYELGGGERGAQSLTISHEEALEAMGRDLRMLRGWFAEAAL